MVAPYSGPMLPMVARSARLKLESPGPVELDEFFHDAFFAQHLHDGEHKIRRGRAFGQPAVQFETDNFGSDHDDRLAEQRRFGLDAADAPADDTPRPLIIVVCESVPTTVSG